MRLTVRTIQIALGLMWIVDGLLQLQPKMFSTAFATQVLAPSAQGQPAVLAWPLHELVHLVSRQPVGFDVVFAAVQLLIGIGMLTRSTVKPALALSMMWVAGVWALGEGFGMLFTGTASPLTGAPGGVLLYGVLGVVVWPRRRSDTVLDPQASAASGGFLGETWARAAWAALWITMGGLWLIPANRNGSAIAAQIERAATNSPRWLGHVGLMVAHSVNGTGPAVATVLAIASVSIGLGPLVTRYPTAFLVAGSALSIDFWLLGQSMGGFVTGMATDPNSAPLFVLLAVALFPNHQVAPVPTLRADPVAGRTTVVTTPTPSAPPVHARAR
jgi:hypothetical protein